MVEPKDFAVEQQMLEGIGNILSHQPPSKLRTKLKELSTQFKMNLTLEPETSFAFNSEPTKGMSPIENMILESGSGIQILHAIKKYPNLLLVYNLNTHSIDPPDTEVWLNFWLTVFFYSAYCFVLLLWALPLTRSLSRLNKMATAFGAGDLSRRVKPGKYSYIEELEISFNHMASQIQELLEENKFLALSISHDLRTPLSCLRFGVDAAMETDSENRKSYYLERMDEDLLRMEKMIEAFLDYASLERNRLHLQITTTDLNKLISSIVKDNHILAQKNSIDLTFKMFDGKCLVNVDPFWMGRAIGNLITNSINHAKTRIIIRINKHHENWHITVEDDGKGIPENQTDHIFKAFVTLDKSRSNHNQYGLGLAIVSRVIHWHHGNIQVQRSQSLGGAAFIIKL